MTMKEKMKKMLVDKGMSDNQADAVLEEAISRIEEALGPDYKITWDRSADEYPDVVYNEMWLHVCNVAKSWIAKNAPQIGYCPMFD